MNKNYLFWFSNNELKDIPASYAPSLLFIDTENGWGVGLLLVSEGILDKFLHYRVKWPASGVLLKNAVDGKEYNALFRKDKELQVVLFADNKLMKRFSLKDPLVPNFKLCRLCENIMDNITGRCTYGAITCKSLWKF